MKEKIMPTGIIMGATIVLPIVSATRRSSAPRRQEQGRRNL